MQVHKFRAQWDVSLRVRWLPLFYDAEGAETTEAGGKPSIESITPKHVLAVVQLHDGVLQHSVARRLDRAGWKIAEDVHAEAVHENVPVSEAAEKIIRSMSRPVIPRVQSAGGAESTAEDRVKAILDGRKLDLLEVFGSEQSLGRELGRMGCSVLSNTWNLDDLGTRRAVANLVVTIEPRACHVVLPEGTTAEVQRFV